MKDFSDCNTYKYKKTFLASAFTTVAQLQIEETCNSINSDNNDCFLFPFSTMIKKRAYSSIYPTFYPTHIHWSQQFTAICEFYREEKKKLRGNLKEWKVFLHFIPVTIPLTQTIKLSEIYKPVRLYGADLKYKRDCLHMCPSTQ